MNVMESGPVMELFEIREVKETNTDDDPNKSTVLLTVRNLTKRGGNDTRTSDQSSNPTNDYNGRDSGEGQTESNYITETYDEIFDYLNNNENDEGLRDRMIKKLSQWQQNLRAQFFISQAALLPYLLVIIAHFDKTNMLTHLKLAGSSLPIAMGLLMFFKSLLHKYKETGLLLNFSTEERMALILGVLFILPGATSTTLIILAPQSQEATYVALAAIVVLGFVIGGALVYSMSSGFFFSKAILMLVTGSFLLILEINSTLNYESIAQCRSMMFMWPFYLGLTVLGICLFVEGLNATFSIMQRFLEIELKSAVFRACCSTLFYAFVFIELMVAMLEVLIAIDEKPTSTLSSVALVLIISEVLVFVGIVILQNLCRNCIAQDILNLSDFKADKQKERIKIMADVPLYLKKKKTDSYFQKVTKGELAKLSFLRKPNAKPQAKKTSEASAHSHREEPCKTHTISIDKLRELALSSRREDSFKIKYHHRNLTMRMSSKDKLGILNGYSASYRTFSTKPLAELPMKDGKEVKLEPLTGRADLRHSAMRSPATPIHLDSSEPSQASNTASSNCQVLGNSRKLSKEEISENINKSNRVIEKQLTNRVSEKSIRKTEDDGLCLICFTNKSSIIIMPCGHSDICLECSKDIWKNSNLCFLCQQSIDYLLVVEQLSEDIYKVKYSLYIKK